MATETTTGTMEATITLTSPPQITILSATRKVNLLRLFVGREIKYVKVPRDTLPKAWDEDENLGAYLPALPAGGDKVFELRPTGGARCAVFPRGGLGKQDWQQVDTTGLPTDLVAADYAGLERVRGLHTAEHAPRYSDKSGVVVVGHPAKPGELLVCRIVPYPPSLARARPRSADPTLLMGREMRAHALAAEHGLAPRIVGLVTEPDRGFIGFLSEFVEGAVSVEEYRKARIIAGERELIHETVGQAILAAVRRLHELGVLHCDLSLDNILIKPDGQILMVDFEFASGLDGDGLPVNEKGEKVKHTSKMSREIEIRGIMHYTNPGETQ